MTHWRMRPVRLPRITIPVNRCKSTGLSGSVRPARSAGDATATTWAAARAGTREEAAAQPIVLVAVNWSKLPIALAGLPDFAGRIVIDANNPIEAPSFKAVDLQGRVSSEVFAEWVPGARVVKAFNHLQAHLVDGDPAAEGGRRVLFFSGDSAQAKVEVGALIERLGFFGVDLGALSVGGRLVQFPGGPLPALNLVKFG